MGLIVSPEYSVCTDKEGASLGSVMKMSELEGLLTVIGGPEPPGDFSEVISEDLDESVLPTSIDWRNYNGSNWVTPPKNQGGCGSCWSFAAAGVVEAHHNILANNPALDLNLAEQDMLSCSSAGTCAGGFTAAAMYYIRDNGVVDEPCFPYVASDVACSRCANWASRLTTVDQVIYTSPTTPTWIKTNLVAHGPLYSSMYMGSGYLLTATASMSAFPLPAQITGL